MSAVQTDKVVYALEQSRELIRMGWCQGAPAKTVRGRACFCQNEEAVQFDIHGAVFRITWPWDTNEELELINLSNACLDALEKAILATGWEDDRPQWMVINDWNDARERTKMEVVSLIGEAIELAKEQT